MKKVLSLSMVVVMLCTLTAGVDFSAYAGGWVNSPTKYIELNTTYTEFASTTDYLGKDDYYKVYYDVFRFSVPAKSNMTFNLETTNARYTSNYAYADFYIYSVNDVDNCIWYGEESKVSEGYSSARNVYYETYNCSLNAGEYYLVADYGYDVYNGFADLDGTYDFSLTYQPSLSTPSNLKVASRGQSNLALSWGSVGNASGYQIYWAKDKIFKKIAAKKTVSGRSTTSYTGKNFTKGEKYYVKVRAYKTVDGKKYYGSWSKVKSIRVK